MNANLKKIEELQAQNEKLVDHINELATLVDKVIVLIKENHIHIKFSDKWLMSLTDLVVLLYESHSNDKNKRDKANSSIPQIDVMDRIARKIGNFPKV